jgi:hypothetical protein
MEKLAFTRACLSSIRVIIVIMHVSLVALLCQALMGQNPTLEYLLLGTCGRLWPCPVILGIKGHHFLGSYHR